ncbi:hypothetical protein J6590_099331, partial [Homalodisca vitripennis]
AEVEMFNEVARNSNHINTSPRLLFCLVTCRLSLSQTCHFTVLKFIRKQLDTTFVSTLAAEVEMFNEVARNSNHINTSPRLLFCLVTCRLSLSQTCHFTVLKFIRKQ